MNALAAPYTALSFADIERRLRSFTTSLWRQQPICRTAIAREGKPPIRRTSFDGAFIRVPERLAGADRLTAERQFRAAIAHIGAHLAHTCDRFPVGQLKPLQVAMVSLIEDARVEALAIRDYPGLRRLWAGLHLAEPGPVAAAEGLMARLSRALVDPDYHDDNPWVAKGLALFGAEEGSWEDAALSRRIGGLLANDLGQMRLQFNAKTYVVEPTYRDDNLGLWDWGDTPPEMEEDADVVLGSFRLRQSDDPTEPHQRQRPQEDAAQQQVAARERVIDPEQGIPVARYGEWDYVTGQMRTDWTTLVEYQPPRASTISLDRIMRDYADVEARIVKLIRTARISRPTRLRRQPEGDRLDLAACIGAAIDRRVGLSPDPRVYETSALRDRDLAVLLLLDISESTKDFIKGTNTTVLSIERAAANLLAQAMASLGDAFAIHAFASNQRSDVRYFRVKDFTTPYDNAATERLAGLRGGYSTRMGAALRHAGRALNDRLAFRRLVLVLSDGAPSDIDVTDRRYLTEDARRAVQELAHRGIDVFCVGLESGDNSDLARIFGRRNAIEITRLETLPQKLTALYLRLTS